MKKNIDVSTDFDGDGFLVQDDCDDTDADRNPGAEERCDGLDNDCDGQVDEEPTNGITVWPDRDQDGYGDPERSTTACMLSAGFVDNKDDCDDRNAAISPRSSEQCDGIDNNCDGYIDDHTALGAVHWFEDLDGDGYGSGPPSSKSCNGASHEVRNNLDCDDTTAMVSPVADERCDGIDNDCDGDVDESGALGSTLHYRDADLDGFGDAEESVLRCEETVDFVSVADDCDDAEPSSYPGAFETCDGMDNTCDGFVDERCATLHRSSDAIWASTISPSSISVGDLNDDGRIDLVTTNAHMGTLSLTPGPLVAGSVETGWSASTFDETTSAMLAFHATQDINDDGRVDLLTAYPYMTDSPSLSELRIHLGPIDSPPNMANPDLRLNSRPGTAEVLHPGRVWFDDVTGDDQTDVLMYNTPDNALLLWPNPDGAETHAINLATLAVDPSSSISTSDFSGDGYADLIIGHPGEREVRLFEGPITDAVSLYTPDRILSNPTPQFGTSLCGGDLLDDGYLTLAVSTRGSDAGVSRIQLFSGSDDFRTVAVHIVGRDDHHIGTDVICKDVDGDGQSDLLSSHRSLVTDDGGRAGTITMFHGSMNHLIGGTIEVATNADRVWKGHDGDTTEWLGEQMMIGDFNDDGVGDLMATSRSGIYVFSGLDWTSHVWTASP